MKRPIITDLNFLRQKSEPSLYIEEQNAIIKDLEDSLDLNRGLGLSAIQIGIKKQVAIIRYDNVKIDLINPIILVKNEKIRINKEGCLSLPNIYIDTFRYNYIIYENNGIKAEVKGIIAVILLHEYYHLQGKLITDFKWRKKKL